MIDLARAMLELGAAMDRMIEQAVRNLAPADDPVILIEWTQGDMTHLAAKLLSGRIISGAGEAKLEAIMDAESRLGRVATA